MELADLKARGAFLFLQDHGDPVWYRGIKPRTLPDDEDRGHSTVEPAEIPKDVLKPESEKLQRILESRRKAKK